jgi:NAD(P)-dependent dehydrogenase (short-subunit alcohol dehydrogenase family)
MSSYVITGAARGLGYEFLRQLSKDPSITVVGLVRNKADADAKVARDGLPKNVHIIEADITSLPAQREAAEQVATLTGGKLDVLINNAADLAPATAEQTVAAFDTEHDIFVKNLRGSFETNVIGVMNTITAFMPLILKSAVKKVITISTGMADAEIINKFGVATAVPYSISKGATNVMVAKYNAAYKEDGVLFLALSPGLVDTGHIKPQDPNEPPNPLILKFLEYAPHFRGPITPEESVKLCLEVIRSKSVENGDGGAFVSQFGNQQWL